MRHANVLRTLALCLSISACSIGSTEVVSDPLPTFLEDPRYVELESTIPALMDEHKVASLSLTFIENGDIAWTQVFGEQSEGVPATPKTMHGMASLTKPVMAEVVLRLMSEGRISLDEPIFEFWTDPNVRSDERNELLTPRILLQHQSGFANWRSMSDGILQFGFDPGSEVQYSGEGYDYLVRVLERMYGKRFEELAAEVLFDPIGMPDTSLVLQDRYEYQRAHRVNSDGEWRYFWAPTRPSAASSLSATTEDYARFVLSVMRQENVSERAIAERGTLSINQVDEYCGPGEEQTNVQPCPKFMGFGIGWFLYGFEDHTLYYHSGSNWGEKSYVLFSPELNKGLVVAASAPDFEVIHEVIQVLYGNEDFLAFERN